MPDKTPLFSLPLPADTDPLADLYRVVRDLGMAVEYGLTAAGVAPSGYADAVTALAARTKAAEDKIAALTPTPWVTMTLLNGATSQPGTYLAPRYRRVQSGAGVARVEFAGLLYTPPANITRFTSMPAGFRPTPGVVLTSVSDDDAFNVYVQANGDVYTASRTAGFVSLEGLSYSL